MSKASRASLVASMCCVSALPPCTVSAAPHDSSHGPAQAVPGVAARRYQVFLHNKVSSALSNFVRRMHDPEGREGSVRQYHHPAAIGHNGTQPAASADATNPAAVITDHATATGVVAAIAAAAASPAPGAAGDGGQGRVKRSSTCGGSAQQPLSCQPSSSIQATPSTSDDCGTPAAPAAPGNQPGVSEHGWGVPFAAALGLPAGTGARCLAARRPCSPREGGAFAGQSGLEGPQRPGPQQHRHQQEHSRQLQQHEQQRHRQPQRLAHGGEGGDSVAATVRRHKRPRLTEDSEPAGTAPPRAGAQCQVSTGPSSQRIPPASPAGGIVAPPEVPPTRGGQLRTERDPHARPNQHTPAANGPSSHGPGPVTAAVNHVGVPQTGGRARLAPPSLCSLPEPGLTLQHIIARQPTAPAALAPGSASVPSVSGQGRRLLGGRRGDGRLGSTILEAASPGLRAVLEGTAAAAAHHNEQLLARLPPMEASLRRWPLPLLEDQLDDRGGAAGSRAQGHCGVDLSLEGPGWDGAGRPMLQLLHTALPRRGAAVELQVPAPDGSWAAGRFAVARFPSVPLAADTCTSRDDLWDLFQVQLQQVELRPPAAAERAELGSVTVTGAAGHGAVEDGEDGGAGRGPAGAETGPACFCACHLWAEEEGATGGGGDDDPDVFITDEGLVCLASLVSQQRSRGDWRLPFLVKQREPCGAEEAGAGGEDGAGAGSAAGAGPPCCNCRSRTARQGHGSATNSLIFTEPIPDSGGLLLDSWRRVCLSALGARRTDSDPAGLRPHGACAGTRDAADTAATDPQPDSCPCCQQDEWRLGGMSLLVLSHCHAGVRVPGGSGGGGAGTAHPLQLLAIPAPGGDDVTAAQLEGQAAAAGVRDALKLPELAHRAQLMSGQTVTLVMAVDLESGRLAAQHRVDCGSLSRMSTELGGDMVQRAWRLVHYLLRELRRLPPGPYMLCLEDSGDVLELRGEARKVSCT